MQKKKVHRIIIYKTVRKKPRKIETPNSGKLMEYITIHSCNGCYNIVKMSMLQF